MLSSSRLSFIPGAGSDTRCPLSCVYHMSRQTSQTRNSRCLLMNTAFISLSLLAHGGVGSVLLSVSILTCLTRKGFRFLPCPTARFPHQDRLSHYLFVGIVRLSSPPMPWSFSLTHPPRTPTNGPLAVSNSDRGFFSLPFELYHWPWSNIFAYHTSCANLSHRRLKLSIYISPTPFPASHDPWLLSSSGEWRELTW